MDRQGFERLVKQLFNTWQERNAEAAISYFTVDAVYAKLPGGRSLMGSEEIRLHFMEAAKEERNPSFILHKTIFCDDEGAVEWTYMYDSASTGQQEVYRGVAMAQLDGDKFASWREYVHQVQMS